MNKSKRVETLKINYRKEKKKSDWENNLLGLAKIYK